MRDIEVLISEGNLLAAKKLIEKIPEEHKNFLKKLYMADVLRLDGNYDESIKLCDKIIHIDNATELEKFKSKVIKAYSLYRLSKQERSEDLIQDAEWTYQAIQEEDKINANYYYGELTHLRGNIFMDRRLHIDAIKNWEIAIEIFSESNFPAASIGSLENIGMMYCALGQVDKGIEYLNKAKEIFEYLSEPSILNKYWLTFQFGRSYIMRGEYTTALEYLEEAEDLLKILNNPMLSTGVIANLFYTNLRLGNKDLAEKYMVEFKEISQSFETKELRLDYQLMRAAYLKSSKKAKLVIEAQHILENLIEETDQYSSGISIFAITALVEILLEELKSYGEEDVLNEIIRLTDRLQEDAEVHHSISFGIQVNLLQSKLALIRGNIVESNKFLDLAEKQAESSNFNFFVIEIQNERENMRSQMAKWEAIINNGASIKEKMDLVHYQEYIENAKKAVGLI